MGNKDGVNIENRILPYYSPLLSWRNQMSIKKTVIFSYAIDVEITDEEIKENISKLSNDDEIDKLAEEKAKIVWDEINPKTDEMNIEVEDGE